MSKMKKVLAMLLTLAMVFGMALTASADTIAVPSSADKAEIKVTGLPTAETTVIAYQIVEADYYETGENGVGFKKYVEVSSVDVGDNPEKPEAAEVAKIANAIKEGTLTSLKSVNLTKQTDGSYTAEVEAGYWLVIADPVGHYVFNPMIAGVYYENTDGSGNTITGGTIDSTQPWTLNGTTTVAKQSNTTVEKEIVNPSTENKLGDDVTIGEEIQYQVTADIPVYSEVMYEDVTFKVTDKLSTGISFLENPGITVMVEGNENSVEAGSNTYSASTDGQVLTVDFADRFIFDNGGKEVTITYKAELNENALVDNNANDNEVELEYTREPGEEESGKIKPPVTHHYTFDFNVVKEDDKKQKLGGATFTLTPKEGTNGTVQEVTSEEGTGNLHFTGLDVGTYTLQETDAPDGYQIDSTEHTVVISATYNETTGEMTSYSITVDNQPLEKWKSGDATVELNTLTFTNTKLVNLPSTGGIGTTIFTIGGCAIMIAAAFFFFVSRRKDA